MSRMTGSGGPGMAMRGETKKAKDVQKTLKRLMKFIQPYGLSMGLIMVLAISATTFSIISPKLMGQITSLLVEGILQRQVDVSTTFDLSPIYTILQLMAVLYTLSAVFNYLQNFMMIKVTQKINFELRVQITQKINTLPLKYFDTQSFGDVLSRITNDVDAIGQSLQQSITQVIVAVTTVLGILMMMLSISFKMTLIALVSLPISLLFVTNIVKMGQKYFKRRQQTLGALNGLIEETLGAHPIIKVFNAEERQIKRFDKLSDKYFKESWMAELIGGLMMPIISFIGNLTYVAVTVLGGYLVIQGSLKVGDIQAFIQYTRNFSSPINQIANMGTLLQSTLAAAERVFEFIDVEDECKDVSQPQTLSQVRGDVEFKQVAFGYSIDQVFIQDLSFKVKAGQRVAIVGPTGAGKTTLINLLMRFYDVLEGSIEIDGVNIQALRRQELRHIFGMVLQDTWLFSGSILDNLRFSNPSANMEDLMQASSDAKVDHFVQTLPEGYDLKINEEASNISQGQKQLMTIARAFLVHPSILILDEATSSVDTRTEVMIQKAMEHLMGSKTSFIIAHRLSTIRDADLILVMNHGSIIEQGTHASLIAKNGFYASLYAAQFDPEE